MVGSHLFGAWWKKTTLLSFSHSEIGGRSCGNPPLSGHNLKGKAAFVKEE
jgi:hypothetical protein